MRGRGGGGRGGGKARFFHNSDGIDQDEVPQENGG